MTDIKQVKVDNWGIYFLQRLKHFFNRTDYCDLTLQFQDNAQLKVHRLVLSACTEYFELLERTCEMYEDCLVMPDDLQADVVVPIVNFMYTGHLEFRMDLLERLYQTSQILNMPVLTKLLESHRLALKTPAHSYSAVKRFNKISESSKLVKPTTSNKRSYSKAFENNSIQYRDKKVYQSIKLSESVSSPSTYRPPSPITTIDSSLTTINKKPVLVDPRPTRYELPEELDNDNVFDNSFCNISYTCKPLMVHPENLKRYSSKRAALFSEASSSKKLLPGTSTVDIVECKRIAKDDNIFDDTIPDHCMNDDMDIFQSTYNSEPTKDSSQLFDQILDDGPKVTIETKDSKAASNLDHAKIISEVLKKYPHLVKSNKNIKLKILNTPSKGKKQQKSSPNYVEEPEKVKSKLKTEAPDYTYETDVIDSQQAAKLIAMGAENTKGPWICLICGTPGKALHFTSYYKFRRHLVEVHNEKPVSNICEYCGLRSLKRNYLLHHLYSQHGVEPPPQYHFPKCNRCNYIALTEGLLVKHKMTHKDVKNFRCNVCSAPFNTTKQLLQHIQVTGHKYSAERKTNLQCIYCLKSFLRDGNLYAHLKTYHRKEAKSDGIIEDSDDDKPTEEVSRAKSDNRDSKYHNIKYEPVAYENDFDDVDVQYQIQQRHDGDIQLTPRKQHNVISNTKQKILNPGFGTPKPPPAQKPKPVRKTPPEPPSNFLEDMNIPSPPTNHNEEEIVLIDNTEYIMRDNQLIPRNPKPGGNEYIISDMIQSASLQTVQPTTSMAYTDVHNPKILEDTPPSIVMKKTPNINQPIQIVVSNEEEYKALMASNHPILFDNGDANKTLTVLTTQHNSTLDTAAIDLDNTQTNDMMIIQEDYPLNVTEAVSTDNSNIVVVYSHPVDQNKQYQILTTGGIGSQFVQSSAIITQNYETVTTSTPVMSAHTLQAQGDTTWQDNMQTGASQQGLVEPQPILQNIVRDVDSKRVEKENSNNLSELPEVHLGGLPQTMVTTENQVIDTSNELNIVNSEDISQALVQEIVQETHNISATPMDTDILRESIIEQGAPGMTVSMQITDENVTGILTNEVNPQVVGINEQVAGMNEQLDVNQQVHNVSQQVNDANQQIDDANQQIDDVNHQVVDVNQQINDVNQQINDVNQQVTDCNQENTDAHQEVHDVNQQLNDVNQQLNDLNQQLSDANQQLYNVNQELNDGNQQLGHVNQQPDDVNQANDVNQDSGDVTQQNDEINRQVDIINQQVNIISQQIQQVSDVTQQVGHVSEVEDVTQQVGHVSQVEDVTQQVSHVSQVEDVTQQVGDLAQQIDDVTHTVADITEQIDNVTQPVGDVTQGDDGNQEVGDITEQADSVSQQFSDVIQKVNDVVQQVDDVTQVHQNVIQSVGVTEECTTEITPQEQQVVDSLMVTENSEITENISLNNSLEDEAALPESQAYDDIVSINHNTKEVPQPYSKETVEKIQTLASEWSEDEYDIPEDTPTAVKHIPDTVQTEPEPQPLEETIDDIQLKVQNHVLSTKSVETLPDIETEESENSMPEDAVMSPQVAQPTSGVIAAVSPVTNDPQTQQKISSLLNDWEDNDSQEENNSDDPVVQNENKGGEPNLPIETTPKIDNIKSLVSDWDEEDEDTTK